jgi:hypothetical protein
MRRARAVLRTLLSNTHEGENSMDIDILTRAPEQKAGVPAEPFGNDDVMRIFEACQAIER